MSVASYHDCPREDIAAYLDGELADAALDYFEAHVAKCTECRSELLSQRQLLCALEAAFNRPSQIDLPENFTRMVATHAEHDLRGLSERIERRRAVQLCAVLALTAFALLGGAAPVVLQPARNVVGVITRVLDVFSQAIFGAAEGAAIVGRMIGRAAVFSPYGLGALIVLVFIIAISLLPRLITSYHRTQIIE